MSYCRFSEDSDVYLYAHVAGGWECCACIFKDDFDCEIMLTLGEVLAHLQAHRDAGHQVLEYAFGRVREEIEELGEDYVNLPYEENDE